MSSKIDLYTLEHATIQTWSEGPVYYWPESVQKQGKPPILCRLIRIPAQGKAKRDVWLLTDILDPTRLSKATAAKFYRWRWRNEGVFRISKRTINKLKLSSRTVRLVHREAEASLLALQILLAHADRPAVATEADCGGSGDQPEEGIDRDPSGAQWHDESTRRELSQRLESCRADSRCQTSPKACREWPRRTPHKPPKPPILHTLTDEQKELLHKHLNAI